MKLVHYGWLGTEVAVVLLVFWACVCLIRRRPAVGFVLIGAFTLTSWTGPFDPVIASLGRYSIYPADLVVALLFASHTRRRGETRMPDYVVWVVWVIAALITISYLTGMAHYGIGTATVEFRLVAFPFLTLWWIAGIDQTTSRFQDDLRRLYCAVGWGLVIVAGANIAKHGLGNASAGVYTSSGDFISTRPLVSGQALVLSLCLFAQFDERFATRSRALRLLSSIAFFGIVVVVQQRDVWAASAAAAAVLVFSGGQIGKRTRGLAIGGALALAAFVSSGVARSVVTKLAESLTSNSTYLARSDSWSAFLSDWSRYPMFNRLFGQSLGYGFGRYVQGLWETFSPHNWYVICLLRVGLVGMVCVAGLTMLVFGAAIVRHKPYAAAMIAMTAVYGWAYAWDWYALMPAGLAMTEVLAPSLTASAIGVERPLSRLAGSAQRLGRSGRVIRS